MFLPGVLDMQFEFRLNADVLDDVSRVVYSGASLVKQRLNPLS